MEELMHFERNDRGESYAPRIPRRTPDRTRPPRVDLLNPPGASSPAALAAVPSVLGTFALVLVLLLLGGCSDVDLTPPVDPVSVVDVLAPVPSVELGDTVRLVARARNAAGVEVPGRAFGWSSSDTLVARVSHSGLVTGVGAGSARIRATTAGRTGEVEIGVTVTPPEPPPPPPAPELATITPAQVLERTGAVDLALEGVHFRSTSRALWNGIPLATTFVNEGLLVARVPDTFTGQPLEAGITVETVLDFGVPPLPPSAIRTFRVTPRPVASLTLRVAGNHLFRGQALEDEVEVRNDLGERVFGPGLGVEVTNTTVANWDWMGQLRGRVIGSTVLRYRFGSLVAEAPITVSAPPVGTLVVEARPEGTSELFRMVFDRTGLQPLRIERILPMGTRAGEPALSPDGQRVAFAGTASDGTVNIWTVNLDGTGLRRLTDDGFRADQPAWSPDGTRIAFRTFRRGGPELWVMRADGSDPRPVVEAAWMAAEMNQDPTWSPDGTRLLFSRRGPQQLELWSVRVDGTLPAAPGRFLTVPGHDLRHPSWQADGNLVAFEARNTQSGVVLPLLAFGHSSELLYPLNALPEGLGGPALLGGDWIALVGPGGMPGSTVPTLHVRELNGFRVSIPFPTWMGRVMAVAAPRY
jgi:hypothetical protein